MKFRTLFYTISFDFAVKIVRLGKDLQLQNEYILSKQIIKSGTSIGANVNEAQYAQSSADFISKMSIALKEANETVYWLRLLMKTEYISSELFEELNNDITDIKYILIAIVKKSKGI